MHAAGGIFNQIFKAAAQLIAQEGAGSAFDYIHDAFLHPQGNKLAQGMKYLGGLASKKFKDLAHNTGLRLGNLEAAMYHSPYAPSEKAINALVKKMVHEGRTSEDPFAKRVFSPKMPGEDYVEPLVSGRFLEPGKANVRVTKTVMTPAQLKKQQDFMAGRTRAPDPEDLPRLVKSDKDSNTFAAQLRARMAREGRPAQPVLWGEASIPADILTNLRKTGYIPGPQVPTSIPGYHPPPGYFPPTPLEAYWERPHREYKPGAPIQAHAKKLPKPASKKPKKKRVKIIVSDDE